MKATMNDALVDEQFVEGERGIKLFIRTWLPASTTVGAVAIVPGFNSHSAYYAWTAQQLVDAGFAVHAIDLRGRGRSGGERFHLEDFDDYVSDAAALVAHAKRCTPAKPVFLLGHSAGGVVACSYAVQNPRQIAGLVCESFAYQVPGPAAALWLLKGVSHLAPRAHVLKLSNADFSRDPEAVKVMDADPLIAGESQTALTVAEMVRANERLHGDFGDIRVPVLILHGKADKVTLPAGSREFFERAGAQDKTLKLYDDGAHDLLNDLERSRVVSDISEWLVARARVGGA